MTLPLFSNKHHHSIPSPASSGRELRTFWRFTRCGWLAAIILLSGWQAPAQQAYWPPDETAPEPETVLEDRPRYNLPIGNGGVNLSAGLRGLYVDNVFLQEADERDDFVLIPEVNVGAFMPVGQSNTLVLDLGIAYYYYLDNTSLNSDAPLINPNSELAFNLRVRDFTFRFSEQFSYEENPVYRIGESFFNVYDTGIFARYHNRAGVSGSWDLNDLVVSLGYYHENLWAGDSYNDYINRASELLNADAFFALTPKLKAGWEAAGSVNRFENRPLNDSWRARTGPAVRLKPSRFLDIRLGAGYEHIEYDSSEASALGIDGENTFYAYGSVGHELNRFVSHSLRVAYENRLGYNAGNLSGPQVSYSLTWRPKDRLRVSPHVTALFFEESFGSGPPTLYDESLSYLLTGLAVRYQIGQHWQAGVSWDYRLRDSEVETHDYAQNQVALEVMYQF